MSDTPPAIWLTGEEHAMGRQAATRHRYETLHGSPPSPHTPNAPGAWKRPESPSARFGALLGPPPITEDGPPPGLAVSGSGWQAGVAIWHLAYWGSAIAAGLLLTELIW